MIMLLAGALIAAAPALGKAIARALRAPVREPEIISRSPRALKPC